MSTLILSDNEFIKSNIIRIFKKNDTEFDLRASSEVNLEDENIIDQYSLIISAHCKKIFPSKLTRSVRCINIHPGLNPYNRGFYPQAFSLVNKLPTGATIHEMDEEIDNGPIIVQERVEIQSTDTSFSLYNKIIRKEIELLEDNFDKIIQNNYLAKPPSNPGNLNLKINFDKLCKLDLDNVDTFENHINQLRALTFDGYENAYFIDDKGEKIFVRVELKS
jgi:dTDP-4-amino-4,6-dideoxyglucose formyltransferase